MSSRPATRSHRHGTGGAEAAKGSWPYAPFSRVRLEELSWSVLGLYGPRAREYFGDLEHQSREIEIEGRVLLSVGVAFPVPATILIGPQKTSPRSEYLTRDRRHPRERRRLRDRPNRSRRPRFGADITPGNFPGESENSLERAVSFEKGCYLARRRWRGCITVAARTRSSTASSWSQVPWNRRRRDEILQGEKKLMAQSPQ